MKSIKVTIGIPSYNSENYISKAIESALNQTYKNIEIIVVDDKSKDNTFNIAKKFEKKDSRIKCYQNKNNIGLVGNWNKCIELSKGEYINILHSDDVYHENIVELQLSEFLNDKSIGVVFTLANIINEQDEILVKRELPDTLKNINNNFIYNYYDLIKSFMLYGNFIICPSAMIKKNIFNHIGKFDENYKFAVDAEMWLRIAKQYPIKILPERLIDYRVSTTHASFNYHKKRVRVDEIFDIIDLYNNKDDCLFDNIDQKEWNFVFQKYNYLKVKDYLFCYKNSVMLNDIESEKKIEKKIKELYKKISFKDKIRLKKVSIILLLINFKLKFFYKSFYLLLKFLKK